MSKARKLVTSRTGRFVQLGSLAGGLAGGAIMESSRQLMKGRRPVLEDVLLTPGNVRRIGEKLSQMRGAAMKLGQLLSMDVGTVLSPELASILSHLQEDSHTMPLGDIAAVLKSELGSDWNTQFEYFNFSPIASASIGQVHEARLKGGERIALKIQYPGIAKSIDSDVDNVKLLLKYAGQLPEGMDLNPLILEAKDQLYKEADYCHEAEALGQFSQAVNGDSRYQVPSVHKGLSTSHVLTMDYLEGEKITDLSTARPDERNRVASDLLELSLREVFLWGIVQTDPNFANYRYSREQQQIQLLDFGAVRFYPKDRVEHLNLLIEACLNSDMESLRRCAINLNYLDDSDPKDYQEEIIKLFLMVTEPLVHDGAYNFRTSDIAARMKEHVIRLRLELRYSRIPPPDILFLHRKLGGVYLLLNHLGVSLDVREIWNRAKVAA